jgi:MFS family permease|nr:MFS transporter [Kofleriaceae bacterium]
MAEDRELAEILRVVGGRALNTFGRQVITTTVLWELYERTGDNLTIAFVGLVQVLPVIALFVPSGAFVDNSDRRRVTTVCSLLIGVVGLLLGAASATDAPLPTFFVILLGLGAINSVFSPATASLIPLVLRRDQLERANRVASSLGEVASVVAPGVAGAALLVVPYAWVYGLAALSSIIAAVLYRSLPKPREVVTAAGAARRDWRLGLRFIFANRLLLPALTLDMFAVLFAGATALLPAVAKDVLHTDSFGYGVLRSAEAIGGATMAIIGGRIRPWQHPGRVLLIVVAGFAAVTIGFGLSTWLPLSVVMLALGGAFDNVSVVIRLTLEQMVVPDDIRGRVSAVHFVFIGMSNELGAAESGLAAALIGTVPAIVGGGALAMAVVALVAKVAPEFRRMKPLGALAPGDGQAPPSPAASSS